MAKFLYSRVHHKPNNMLAMIIIINSVVVFLAIGILIYNFFIFGPRDRVIKLYIHGLHDSSFAQIKELAAKEFDSDPAIEEDLKKYGGTSFAIHTNYRSNPTNGLAVDTNIYGFKGFKPYKTQLTLIGMGDAWYIVKGDLKEEYKNLKKE